MEAGPRNGTHEFLLEVLVQSANKHMCIVASAAMDSHGVVTFRQEREAPRLIKTMACQMQCRVVACSHPSFKQVQIQGVASDEPRDFGRVLLDASAMQRDHCDTGRRPGDDREGVVDAFDAIGSKVSEALKGRCKGSVSKRFAGHSR